jgi:hypothetical protein
MRTIAVGLVLVAAACVAATAAQHASPATLSCSPAPCTLSPTLASEGSGFVTDTPIAATPMDGSLLLGSVDFNCTGGSNVGEHLSTNGGSTWSRVDCMPDLRQGKRNYAAVDEPSVGYDAKGDAYVSGVFSDATGNYGLVAVQKSAGGVHWAEPAAALLSPGPTGPYLTHLAVDANSGSPRSGAVYVSGVMVSRGGADNQVLVSHSRDGGATWTEVAVDAVQSYPAQDNFTRLAIGRSGTAYATWLNCGARKGPSCPISNVMFSESTDGGNTWSAPEPIATVTLAPDGLPHTFERAYDYPSIAVDNSSGPYASSLYVVMYNWTGSYLKVITIRSTDGGKTWSEPLGLAPKSDTHDQFFPAISLNKDGLVGVSWLDRRNDPNDIDYQAFAAISYDGGQTFGPNWQLTTAFSNPKLGFNNWIGDYTGNTWVDNKFIAAWMDSSNGIDMQEMVGGVQLK